jgi:predicted acylesterase/phospholipase RssA
MNATHNIPSTPLAKIALCCSGGGYRAASFHLGTMSYLNRLQYQGKPLLDNVKMLSTVSGGTITGIVYSLQKQEGRTFQEIFDFIMARLRTLDLIKLGVEKLNPGSVWQNPLKQKNLINAFAELYNKHFTSGATFAELDRMTCHLEAVAFNSTEFDHALNFRFRNRGTGFFGNFYLQVTDAQAGEIRLADAMAASSCFPGGFEPILWPGDFAYDGARHLLAIKGKPTGLMDGGIYDNQGIDSVLKYKQQEFPYFDLILISDVASPYMDAYGPVKEGPKKGINAITVGQASKWIRGINTTLNISMPVLTALFALLPFKWQYIDTTRTGVCLGLAGMFLIGWVIKLLLVAKGKKLARHFWKFIQNKVPPFYLRKLSALNLKTLSIHRIQPLLFDRINSLVSLLLDVFLKVVRRLNYNIVYTDDRLHFRRISTLIRELTEEDYANRSKRPGDKIEKTAAWRVRSSQLQPYSTTVGPKIKKIAEDVAGFGTTLWFTEKDELDDMLGKLVATGQFTLCYNMIEYLEILIYNGANGFDALPAATQEALRDLLRQCKDDWIRFQNDPLFLIPLSQIKNIV